MSEPDSPDSPIDDSFWRNSPSPEAEDEMGEEGLEYGFEIIGEEVGAYGEVRYEVDWDDWKRADGTTQTWQRMGTSQTREWRNIQRRQRDAILKDTIDIDLHTFSGVDIHNDETRLRAQAYDEKLALRRGFSPKLDEDMAKLLAEKLSPSADLGNPQSSTRPVPATPVGRGLRLSTVRQQQRSPESQRQISGRGWDSTSASRTPTPSSVPGNSAPALSSSSSGSSSRMKMFPSSHATPQFSQSRTLPATANPPSGNPHAFPSSQAALSPSSQSENPTETFVRDSQNRASHKRKAVDDEIDHERGQSRDHPTGPTNKGKAPMHRSSLRLEWSQKWTKIARAAGAAPVTIVNDLDDEEVPFLALGFSYLEKGYIYPDYIERPKMDFQVGCDCKRCVDASQCDCQTVSEVVDDKGRKAFAYTKAGLFSFKVPRHVEVVECNTACCCGPGCINRVSQQPRDVPLEIFKTKEKGWGVRTAVDIVRGKVLGMYSGKVCFFILKIISRMLADNMTNSRDGEYIFDLDGQEDLKEGNDEDLTGKYSIDSRMHGNWTHFVNHSCTPNMIIYLAVYETIPGTNLPYLTYVAQQLIKAGTELTMDYDPGLADMMDLDELSMMEGVKKCLCGSKKCRQYVRMC